MWTLTDIITLDEHMGVMVIKKYSKFPNTRTTQSNSLVSYPEYLLRVEGSYSFEEVQLVYSIALANRSA